MNFVAFFLLAACVPTHCQSYYESADTPSTITVTETLRVTSTSDVWNTELVENSVFVTQLSTNRNYVPAQPATVTSIIRVTATPVSVVTKTEGINPVRTVVSYVTSFATVTETQEYHNTITHVDVFQHVVTVPVSSVQTLVQREISTTMVITTATVTSRTTGYH
ncbi:uncharacterized protein LOC126984110 [Eriocheir sinensis]|uniref:uncharacterized protein LOC126984110 n=1 Tax=Eriocheir sinensis TaxID=95602 RepID=UPI0021C8DF78|nr:uncharacterized protein LOC126984110 [Eriocheir sinensis]